MTTALMDRLERIARQLHKDDVEKGYRMEFRVCRVCGFAEWVCSSDEGQGFKVVPVDRADYDPPCERCRSAYMRSPEVCEWVMSVLNHQLHESSEAGGLKE